MRYGEWADTQPVLPSELEQARYLTQGDGLRRLVTWGEYSPAQPGGVAAGKLCKCNVWKDGNNPKESPGQGGRAGLLAPLRPLNTYYVSAADL